MEIIKRYWAGFGQCEIQIRPASGSGASGFASIHAAKLARLLSNLKLGTLRFAVDPAWVQDPARAGDVPIAGTFLARYGQTLQNERRSALPRDKSDNIRESQDPPLGSLLPIAQNIPATPGPAQAQSRIVPIEEPYRGPLALPRIELTPLDRLVQFSLPQDVGDPVLSEIPAPPAPKPTPPRSLPWTSIPHPKALWILVKGVMLARRAAEIAPHTKWSIADLGDWDLIEAMATGFANKVVLNGDFSSRYISEQIDGEPVTLMEAVGLAVVCFSVVIGRSVADTDELWPSVVKSLKPQLAEALFDGTNQLRTATKDSIVAACERFSFRHSLQSTTGSRQFVKTIQLQYGIGRGWRDVSISHAPAVVKDLTDRTSPNFSIEFSNFWEIYKRYRGGVLDLEEAWAHLADNPWSPPRGMPDLARFASSSQQKTSDHTALFEKPRLVWDGDEPRLRLMLSSTARSILPEPRALVSIARGAENTRKYIVELSDDGLVFHLTAGPSRYLELDFEHSSIQVGLDTGFEEVIEIVEPGFRLGVFGGKTGSAMATDDPVAAGPYSLLFDGETWDWRPGVESNEPPPLVELSDQWKLLRVQVLDPHKCALHIDGESVWPLSTTTGGKRQSRSERFLTASCIQKGETAEDFEVIVYPIPSTLELVALKLGGGEYGPSDIDSDSGRAVFHLKMRPDLALAAEAERPRLIVWNSMKGRKESFPCWWLAPQVDGFLIEMNGGWHALATETDRARLLDANIGRFGMEDQRDMLLAGPQLCGAIKDSRLKIDSSMLAGWGESLRSCAGPNDVADSRRIVRTVYDNGVLSDFSYDPDPQSPAFRAKFRGEEFELDPGHTVEVWLDDSETPIEVGYSTAGSLNEVRLILPTTTQKAMGVTVFHNGKRIGTRWRGYFGLDRLVRTIEHTPNWPETLKGLLRWKAPILRQDLRSVIGDRCSSSTADTIVELLRYILREESSATDARRDGILLRELFGRRSMDHTTALSVLEAIALIPRDPFDLMSGNLNSLRVALAADPILVVGIIEHAVGEFFSGVSANDLSVAVARLQWAAIKPPGQILPEILTDTELRRLIEAEFQRAEMAGQDGRFLRALILEAARKRTHFWRMAPLQAREANALMYCSSKPEIGRWLAATLLGEFRNHLAESNTNAYS